MCAMKPCLQLESLKPGTARSAGRLLTYSATRGPKWSTTVEYEVVDFWGRVVCQWFSCETDWWSGKCVCLGGEQTAGCSGMKSWSGAMNSVLLLIFIVTISRTKEMKERKET